MIEQFVPYEIALLAKKHGFDELCIGHYYNSNPKKLEYNTKGEPRSHNDRLATISAPLYQQMVDWFDTKELKIIIDVSPYKENLGMFSYKIHRQSTASPYFNTRQEALNAAFEYAFTRMDLRDFIGTEL